MASRPVIGFARSQLLTRQFTCKTAVIRSRPQCRRQAFRSFSSSARQFQQKEYKESFGTRLRRALGETKIKWYPIPVGLGVGSLGLLQLYKVNEREKARQREEDEEDVYLRSVGPEEGRDAEGRPKKRHRIRPSGPWYVSMC